MSMKNPLTLAGIEPSTLTTVLPRSLLHKYDIKSTEIVANFKARLGACSVLLGGKNNILWKVLISSTRLHVRHQRLCALCCRSS